MKIKLKSIDQLCEEFGVEESEFEEALSWSDEDIGFVSEMLEFLGQEVEAHIGFGGEYYAEGWCWSFSWIDEIID